MLFDGARALRGHCLAASKRPFWHGRSVRRSLLTLAIETSCDDTCVAVLGKRARNENIPPAYLPSNGSPARLFFNERITSKNKAYGGIHPLVSLRSHHANLSSLLNRALGALPDASERTSEKTINTEYGMKQKPDFVTVTRGPGMRSNLSCGLDTAKGLSVAWQIPLMAVHHMQAHALTPRLVHALEPDSKSDALEPKFPFLILLVSGGHTLLVHARTLTDHEIMAATRDIAIGDALDKMGRVVLPEDVVGDASDTAFAKHMSRYAFNTEADFSDWKLPGSRAMEILRKENKYGWALTNPLAGTRDPSFSFSGLVTQVEQLFARAQSRGMTADERRSFAQAAMGTAISHLGSRTIIALEKLRAEGALPSSLVVSGGVASNDFLRYVLREMLNVRGFPCVQLVFPPVDLCTDNAAMIAWTGMEMYEEGYRSTLDTIPQGKWSLEKLLQPDTGIA